MIERDAETLTTAFFNPFMVNVTEVVVLCDG